MSLYRLRQTFIIITSAFFDLILVHLSQWNFISIFFNHNDHKACGTCRRAQGSHYIDDNIRLIKRQDYSQCIMCTRNSICQHDAHTHSQGCTHAPEGMVSEVDDVRSEVEKLCLKETFCINKIKQVVSSPDRPYMNHKITPQGCAGIGSSN